MVLLADEEEQLKVVRNCEKCVLLIIICFCKFTSLAGLEMTTNEGCAAEILRSPLLPNNKNGNKEKSSSLEAKISAAATTLFQA